MNSKIRIIFLAVTLIVSTLLLSGCLYTKEDITEYTKERLEEEYGEKFEIKTVIDRYSTISYPADNPDMLFYTTYVKSNGNGYDCYVQEIVSQQFKELALSKLKTMPFDYYLDVDLSYLETEKISDCEITIEEYNRLVEGKTYPRYSVYFSCEALNMPDEQMYNLINSIAEIKEQQECNVTFYFLTNVDLNLIKENFSTYPYVSGSLYNDTLEKYPTVFQCTEDGILKKIENEILTQIKEAKISDIYRKNTLDNTNCDC